MSTRHSLVDVLTSFNGRISRFEFWVMGILPITVICFGLSFLILIVLAGKGWSPIWIVGPSTILGARMGFAVCAKRWHDRDKSGWWNLSMPAVILVVTALLILGMESMVTLVGLGVGTWWLIELGCLAGTDGPNRYDAESASTKSAPSERREKPMVGPWT